MGARLRLDDRALSRAEASLLQAAGELARAGGAESAIRPLSTLSGAGEQAWLFLRGLVGSRAVLAEAAKTAGKAAAVLRRQSAELDRETGDAVAGTAAGRDRRG